MQNTELEKSIHNIYDIGIKVKELYNIIEENEGEIDDEQYSLLQFEKSEIKKVGCDIITVRDGIQSVSDMLSKQIERLTELKAKKDKQIKNIEKALLWVLLNFGEQDKKGIWRLDLDIAQLSTRKNTEKTIVEDESLVPNEYKKFDLEIKDLTKLELEAIESFMKGWNQSKLEIDNVITETKITQKVSKKELKPKLVELQKEIDNIENEYNNEQITTEEYTQLLEEIPNLGAYIKEGDLNLVIK